MAEEERNTVDAAIVVREKYLKMPGYLLENPQVGMKDLRARLQMKIREEVFVMFLDA